MSLRTARTCVALWVGALVCAASAAHAQDTNYWTLQYGTRGELLGGCVVGSAVDLSATFYNPGSLALVKDPKAILTATVQSIQTIRIKDVDPTQDAITSQNIGPEPSLFAGTLPLHWFGGRMAYSFLTRQNLDLHLVEREGGIIGLDATGDTLSIGGEIIFDQNISENWGGVTWAKRAGDHLGVGGTLYGVYRSQKRSNRETVEAFGANGYGASLLDWADVDFHTFRMLAKLGVEADVTNASFGLAFTTHSLPIMGKGTILINRSITGDVDLDGTDDSGADISYGTSLDAEYKTPFSVAFGGSYRWADTTLHGTAEYFWGIDPYTVIESGDLTPSPGITPHPEKFEHALKDVFNWGLGVERRFSEKTTAYISFITDRSAARKPGVYDINVSTWDIYHINGGVAFSIKGTDLTLGGGFAWGSAPLHASPDSEGILPAPAVPSEVTYTRLKAILGFAL